MNVDPLLAGFRDGKIADHRPAGAQHALKIRSVNAARLFGYGYGDADELLTSGIEKRDTFPALLSIQGARRNAAENVDRADIQRLRRGEGLQVSDGRFDLLVNCERQGTRGIFQTAPAIRLLVAREQDHHKNRKNK